MVIKQNKEGVCGSEVRGNDGGEERNNSVAL